VTAVDDAKRDLGARLREIRRVARLQGNQLAGLAGWQPSKVTRIERGQQIPNEDDIRAWCELTGAVLHTPDLIASARNVRAAYLEWQRIAASGLSNRQKQSLDIEGSAQLVRGWENELVPGLLQTEPYARAVLAVCIDFSEIPDDLDRAVATRMQRQAVLAPTEGTQRFAFLLSEQCLYRVVGSAEVMVGQLERLLTAIGAAKVSIGLIPLEADFRCPTTSFLMYDQRMVQVETASAELTITQPREVRIYEKAFAILSDQAFFGEAARKLVKKALERWRAT
jgi:transcriptional regulator with XRE-family HTH domain